MDKMTEVFSNSKRSNIHSLEYTTQYEQPRTYYPSFTAKHAVPNTLKPVFSVDHKKAYSNTVCIAQNTHPSMHVPACTTQYSQTSIYI